MDRKAGNYTMLAYAMNVDFEIVQGFNSVDQLWLAKIESGELTREQVVEAGETLWGVYREV